MALPITFGNFLQQNKPSSVNTRRFSAGVLLETKTASEYQRLSYKETSCYLNEKELSFRITTSS